MKNKFISVLTAVLIFAQTLCFSHSVGAWERITEEAPYSDRAVKILDSLEIDNYISAENESVSRISFVATLMSMVNLKALSGDEKSYFDDVKGEFSGMLNLAADLKIVSKGGAFRPDDSVTYIEAMKMCLALAGYEYECAAAGGWPVGVMSVGYRLKLNKGLNLSQNDALTYDSAMTLLYNLMNLKVVNIVSVGEESKIGLATDGSTLLDIYHGISTLKGIVTENSRSSLYLAKSETRSMVEINSVKYYCDKEYEDLIGQNAVAFVSEEKNEAIAVFSEDNEITRTNGESVISLGESRVTYLDENERKKSVSLENDYDILYNGKAYKEAVNYDFMAECEYISFIDNDRDGVYEIMALTDVTYTLVEKVNYVDKVIYTHSALGENIDLSDDKGQYIIFDEEGNEISIYMVEGDMLLEAAVSQDGLYAMIKQSEKMITGSMTSSDFDNMVIEIDGAEYKITEDFKAAFSNLSVGTKGVFYIGSNGKVVMYKKSSSRLQYGYIIKIGRKSGLGGYEAKLLCENGQIKILDFADKMTVDNGKKSAKEAYEIIESGLNSNIVRFKADDNGDLKLLDTAKKDIRSGEDATGTLNEDSLDDEDSLIMYFSDYTGSYMYKATPKALWPKVNIAEAKVFTIPVAQEDLDDDTKYRVVNCSVFTNDNTMTSSEVELFDVDKYGNCSVMLYKGDITKTSVEGSQSAVIERIRYERNSDDVFEKKLRLLINGKYESYFIGKDIDETTLKGGKELCKGDIIRFKAENDTLISIKVDFDSSLDAFAKTGDIPDDYFNGGNQKYHYQAGKIYSINDKIAYFDLDSEVKSSAPTPVNKRVFSFAWNNLSNFSIPKSTIVKVKIYGDEKDGVFVERDREVSIADLSEVETYLEKGKDADYAVLRQNSFEGRLLVVYKFEN